jgi:hypothetical protein
VFELLILELDLAENDDDSVEIIQLELEDALITNAKIYKKIILAGRGLSATVIPILKKYSQKYSIDANNILYFGRTPYSQDEIETIYALVSIRENTKGFECLSLKNGTKYSWGVNVAHSISQQIRRELHNIARISINGDAIDVRAAINQATEFFNGTPGNLLRAALNNTVDTIKKLVELEIYFFCGNETRTLGNVASASYFAELTSINLSSLEAEYNKIALNNLNLTALNERLEYIRAGIALSNSFHKNFMDKEMPRLFLWFSTYFLKLAQSHANKLQYTAGLALTLRALEVYCQGVLIREGEGSFDNKGDFLINEKKSSGFADAWRAALLHLLCEDESLINLVWRAIEVRNKSIFGHGVIHTQLDTFNQLYAAITKTIKNYEVNHAPEPKLWAPLRKRINSNVFQDIDRSIASKTLLLLGIHPNG